MANCSFNLSWECNLSWDFLVSTSEVICTIAPKPSPQVRWPGLKQSFLSFANSFLATPSCCLCKLSILDSLLRPLLCLLDRMLLDKGISESNQWDLQIYLVKSFFLTHKMYDYFSSVSPTLQNQLSILLFTLFTFSIIHFNSNLLPGVSLGSHQFSAQSSRLPPSSQVRVPRPRLSLLTNQLCV